MTDAPLSRPERFVAHVLRRAAADTGFGARMRRADNKATDCQSWPDLVAFDPRILDNEEELRPYALIGAALCRLKTDDTTPVSDGDASLGGALASCFPENADQREDQHKGPGSARMLRLLACDSTLELCRVLRPLLTLINTRGTKKLCHARLLEELEFFDRPKARERVKLRWAQDFYSRITPETAPGSAAADATGQASGKGGAA